MDKILDNAVRYHYGEFPPKCLDYGSFYRELANAVSALSRYDQELKKMHNNEILLAPLRNQEALLSSRIEGTISTMDEILEYEGNHLEQEDANNPLIRLDVIETMLYQRALKNAQKGIEAGYEISHSFIKQVHQQLLTYGRGANKTPGQYKTEQNYLGNRGERDIQFIPISPEHLQEGMDNLLAYIEKGDEDVLIKTAIVHLEFEALHPFKDGNGRIGRMLIPLILWKLGVISSPHFYISGYFEEYKSEYIATMRAVSQCNDWNSWIRFFLIAVERQAIHNLEVAEKIKALYDEMKEVFTNVLASKYSINVLDFVFTNPVFRNNKFTSASGVPHNSAAKFSKRLVDSGLLVVLEEGAGSRAAMYSFEPLISLVRV